MSNSELTVNSGNEVNILSHRQVHGLYPVLTCPRDKFDEMYNYDVSDLVESNTFKEKSQKSGAILYLSYSHAVRIFRQNFADMNVEFACVENPATGGYVFEELGGNGYFCKAFIHDGYRRSEMYYYPVLSSSNLAVFPEDTDKNGKATANSQSFNKAYFRAIVKAIALWSGLGLKLWTGEDLSSEMIDEITQVKKKMIESIKRWAVEYKLKSGNEYTLPELNYSLTIPQLKEIGSSLKKYLDEAVPVTVDIQAATLESNKNTKAKVELNKEEKQQEELV
jgi:hypothetical protein